MRNASQLVSDLSISLQVYEGDITIRPPFRVLDLIELLSNPTDEKFRRCVRIMERKTWPLLTKIRNQISIECVLNDCIRRIKRQVEKEQSRQQQQQQQQQQRGGGGGGNAFSGGRIGRVPSFHTSPSLLDFTHMLK